jgi:hypothetical protein
VYRDLVQQRLLVRVQQVVAPLHEGGSRPRRSAWSWNNARRRSTSDCSSSEAGTFTRRRQFDRKRQAVHAPCDGDDHRAVSASSSKPGRAARARSTKDFDRRRVGIVRAVLAQNRKYPTVTCASGDAATSRLVVSTRTLGHPWSSASTTSRTSPSRCSHESNRTIGPAALNHLIS